MSLQNDTLVIVVLLFVGAIAAIPILVLVSSFNDAIQSSDVNAQGKAEIQKLDTSLPRIYDWLFAILAIGMPLVSMGLAYFNDIPSVFYWVSLGLVLFLVFIAYGLQEGWESLIADSTAASVAANLPILSLIMNNLGAYSIVVSFLVAWGTYVKLRGGTGGYYGGGY